MQIKALYFVWEQRANDLFERNGFLFVTNPKIKFFPGEIESF